MVIFHSYVKLPEGNFNVFNISLDCGAAMYKYGFQIGDPSTDGFKGKSRKIHKKPCFLPSGKLT